MSQARNHLQAVSPTGSQHQHAIVTNQLVKQYNRQDTDTFAPIYAADTGSATAYAMAPVPGIKFYVIGQIFVFKAANANSGTTPTLNVNGFGAGTITRIDGSALVAGDIPANGFVEVIVTSLTPTFALLTPPQLTIVNTGATTFLGSNVPTLVAGTFTAGPNTGSIGANGQVLKISASATYACSSAGGLTATIRMFDGTNSIANGSLTLAAANFFGGVALSKVVTLSAATTFTLGATDNQGASAGSLNTSALTGAANQATSITWERLS